MQDAPIVESPTLRKTTNLILQILLSMSLSLFSPNSANLVSSHSEHAHSHRIERMKKEKKQKQREKKENKAKDQQRQSLANIRVIQRNLVYVTNLSMSVAKEDVRLVFLLSSSISSPLHSLTSQAVSKHSTTTYIHKASARASLLYSNSHATSSAFCLSLTPSLNIIADFKEALQSVWKSAKNCSESIQRV